MAGNIHRRKKSSDFVTLDTHCSRNKELKWAAKGLHNYLMQLPDDWKVNITDLEKRSLDKRDATTSAMNALIKAGYVVRERKHDEKGRFEGYDYQMFERPEHAVEWLTVNGKPVNGLTVNGKTATSKVLSISKNEKTKEAHRDFETFAVKAEKKAPPVAPPPPESYDVTEIVEATDIPGVSIATPPQTKTLLDAERQILEWVLGDGLETVKYRHETARRKFEPSHAPALVAHYVSIYASTSEASKSCLLRNPVAHFEAGLFKYLQNQSTFERATPGNSGPQRTAIQQNTSAIPRGLIGKIGK